VAGSAKRFCVLKFCCVQKTFHRIYFKHIVKAKVFSPKIYFSPKLYNMGYGPGCTRASRLLFQYTVQVHVSRCQFLNFSGTQRHWEALRQKSSKVIELFKHKLQQSFYNTAYCFQNQATAALSERTMFPIAFWP